MRRKKTALALSTLFSLTLASCGEPKRVVLPLPTPPERLVCEPAPVNRPSVPPEYVIDWNKVTSVPQARTQHDAYVVSVRKREGIVAAYIVSLEGKLFICSNNAQWRRDFEKGAAK